MKRCMFVLALILALQGLVSIAAANHARCHDGRDNGDRDLVADYPADRGCESPRDRSERRPAKMRRFSSTVTVARCGDGRDNADSEDRLADYPMDPGCTSLDDAYEKDPSGSAAPSSAPQPARAFPGAEGFGATTPGGRGGRVTEVTNLNDSGPGSLRAALEATGPRTVVFRTGGTIETLSPIVISSPFVTVAGQTAPGGGITLKASPSYRRGPLEVRTHDVVLRYLRLRAGASAGLSNGRRSLIVTAGSYNVVIDHCSISWGTDVNVSVIDGSRNVTISWSIISEGLSKSTHVEGEHSKGIALSGKNYNSTERTGNISMHHNLMAHNRQRNPMAQTFGTVDVVNNVIYNYGSKATAASDLHARVPLNAVGNYYKPGPDSNVYEVFSHESGSGYGSALYVQGNIGPHRPLNTLPDAYVVGPSDRGYIVGSRHPAPTITTVDALTAHEQVLGGAGVTVPTRDPVDDRIVRDVRNGTGRILNDPSEVGGWPMLAAGAAPRDGDHDGMPDSWEVARGLDPNHDDSAGDDDQDGYTNVEEYLNFLTTV